MTRKDFDALCGGFPHATHVVQWGDASVWKIGGKVFAIGGWSDSLSLAVTFKCSAGELCDPERVAWPASRALSRVARAPLGAARR